MAVIGVRLDQDELVLTKGRDFKWSFENLNAYTKEPEDYPAGRLFIEIGTEPVTEWDFEIDGSLASLKVESVDVDDIPERIRWQLVFLPDGEAAGGDPLARGLVSRQK